MKTRIHLGMPPMMTISGLRYACFQLLKGKRAIGAVLFGYWTIDDVRVQSLRFDEGISEKQRAEFIRKAREQLYSL